MSRRGLLDIEHRAIKNFKVAETALPGGRYLLTVTTLQGIVIERIEGQTKQEAEQEAEQHLRDFGYERIPSFVAFEIDQEAK